jgi:ABC-type branched-subunit amino acid transport system substrate-binding protein
VGFILPEQGDFAQEARSLVAGFDYYVKEAGVSNLTVLRRDSGSKDEKTLEALTGLLATHNVDFVISPLSLEGSETTVRGGSGTSTIVFVSNPSVRLVSGEMCDSTTFRVRPNTYQSAQPMCAWALKNLGKRVFITGSDDAQGNETADFFAHGFERAGGTFGDRAMLSSSVGNFSSIIEGIEKTKSDFVFAAFAHKDALGFLRAVEARNPRLKNVIIGPETLSSYPGGVISLGKSVKGLRTLNCLKDPAVFAQRVKKVTGIDVAYAERAAEGYDIAKIIDLSARNAVWDEKDRTPLVKYMESLELQGPRGDFSFDKNHEPIVNMLIQEWRFSGRTAEWKTEEEIPEVRSLDFGCGRIGFPRKPDMESREEESLWEDIEE